MATHETINFWICLMEEVLPDGLGMFEDVQIGLRIVGQGRRSTRTCTTGSPLYATKALLPASTSHHQAAAAPLGRHSRIAVTCASSRRRRISAAAAEAHGNSEEV